jgi:hypothetical protein
MLDEGNIFIKSQENEETKTEAQLEKLRTPINLNSPRVAACKTQSTGAGEVALGDECHWSGHAVPERRAAVALVSVLNACHDESENLQAGCQNTDNWKSEECSLRGTRYRQ